MEVTLSNINTFELNDIDMSEQKIKDYWSPDRKAGAINVDTMLEEEVPEQLLASNAVPTTDPVQADLTQRPFNAGGKIFFTLDNKDFVGSAAIIGQSNMLLTAAHCIQDNKTGNLAENFLFSRCYEGEISAEDIAFKKVVLKENWFNEKSRKWDYAIAILAANSTVEPLKYSTEDITGKTITAYGYPGNIFEGAQMVFIKGTAVKGNNSLWRIGGNKMLSGCSGGPWVLDDNETIVGLNGSSTSLKTPNVLLSPVFDSEFDNLYQYALSLAKED